MLSKRYLFFNFLSYCWVENVLTIGFSSGCRELSLVSAVLFLAIQSRYAGAHQDIARRDLRRTSKSQPIAGQKSPKLQCSSILWELGRLTTSNLMYVHISSSCFQNQINPMFYRTPKATMETNANHYTYRLQKWTNSSNFTRKLHRDDDIILYNF